MKKNNGFIQVIIILIILLIILVIGILAINVFSDEIELNEDIEDFSNKFANTLQTSVSDINNKINNNTTQSSSSPELEELIKNINSTNTSSSNTQSTTSVPTVYFYNQLNDWSKIIYSALYKNKENMKTGTYKIKIDEKISELLKQENGSELLQEYYQSAVEAFMYDNPDVFYLNVNNLYINIETTKKLLSTTYNVYLDNGNSASYLSDGYYSKEQIEECENKLQIEVDKIIKNNTGTDYQKIKGIHDYLIENLVYDQTLAKNDIYNIYGAIVNKECVCEGYAKSYKYLLNKAGIESVIVIGEAINKENESEPHAWNYVKMNNNWYAVDCTWDDPIVIGGRVSNSTKYQYFLKGYNSISKDHIANGQFTEDGKIFTYPDLSQIDYD